MRCGLFLLRLIVGGIFAAHGYPKLFGGPEKKVHPDVERYLGGGFTQFMQSGGPSAFAGWLRSMGVPAPAAVAWLIGLLEFFGGILLIFGRLTRPVAFLLSIDMGVAIWKVHWKNGLIGAGGYEFALSLLASCLALFFEGSGKTATKK